MTMLEKFLKALEQVQVAGRWSMGLIITHTGSPDLGDRAVTHISVTEAMTPMSFVAALVRACAFKHWAAIDVRVPLSSEMMMYLQLLATQNRLQTHDTVLTQPDEMRIVVTVSPDVLALVESHYPDFRQMFGPIITLS